ncbi:MAG: carboxypeptidase M32 [Phycisphaerales bacterium JB040]
MTTAAAKADLPSDLSARDAYARLVALRAEAAHLQSVSALLGWDQETYMPARAAPARAAQSGLMAALVHQRSTDPRIGELIRICEEDGELNRAGSITAAELRELRRDYEKATRLPESLVRELAEAGSAAQQAWKAARSDDDFGAFRPHLEKMMGLSRAKAEALGVPDGGELYDALLDQYEPGARSADIEATFTPLRERLSAFVQDIADNGTPPDTSMLDVTVPEPAQHAFGLEVLAAMGFDLEAGRLDTTTHPFCEGTAPGDTRLTTRYRESRFTDALYGTMHEGGHGLYEQGLPKSVGEAGMPSQDSVSLGIHESQSRLWENFVGRSEAFWTWAKPIADRHFGDALKGVSPAQMAKAVNTAQPSFIRVEADEGTYNLHVMLRFDLERAMVRGDLAPGDLPGVWNERFRELFGLDVPSDAKGCMQDVHWSFGLIGYFPTYTLGNLYAAQQWEALNRAMPDLDRQIARGEFSNLLAWLKTHIHVHGRRYPAGELNKMATGHELSADPLMKHLERRIRPAYGLG